MENTFFDNKVIVKTGDITKENVDAIVNAANSSLLGGGGVDGAIHNVGGPDILSECKMIRASEYKAGLPTGKAVITTAGKLPAKYVIHTVGPIWHGGKNNEEKLLSDCYYNCLELLLNRGLKTIAFPAISTGVYGYPKDKAALVVGDTIKNYMAKCSTAINIEKIYFIFFSDKDMQTFLDNCNF